MDHRPDLSGQRRLLVLALTNDKPRFEPPVRFGAMETVDDVRAALAAHDYLADEGLATAIFLALRAAAPAAARGRGRRRQDRGGQGARALDRRRAAPPAVLRGHRRRPGRLRVGLRPPAAPPPRGRGRAAARSSRTSSTPSASSCSGRCCGRSTTGGGPPPVLLIDEVDRADDEFEAFLLEILSDYADHGARARHVPRRACRRSWCSRRTAPATCTTR